MAAFICSLIVCLVLGTVFADETTKTESDLRKALFENYDKLARPVRNINDVVPVHVMLHPITIRDVDVKDKTVKLDTWFYMRWVDVHLTWDPSEYGGFNELSTPSTEVWRPDIALYTASPDTYTFPTVMSNVFIFPNGTVLWVPPFSFKSRCPPSEDQVTADTFQCTLEVGPWTHDVRSITAHELMPDMRQGMGEQGFKDTNPKWSLDSMVASSEQRKLQCCDDRYSIVKFDVLLRKKAESDD